MDDKEAIIIKNHKVKSNQLKKLKLKLKKTKTNTFLKEDLIKAMKEHIKIYENYFSRYDEPSDRDWYIIQGKLEHSLMILEKVEHGFNIFDAW